MKYFYIYLIIINLTGFFIALSDKKRAVKGKYRISEKTLFAVSLLGGGAGMLLSMRLFRHKTRRKRFMVGIPVILAVQAAFFVYIYFFSGIFI